jgi:hypothetical protein
MEAISAVLEALKRPENTFLGYSSSKKLLYTNPSLMNLSICPDKRLETSLPSKGL